MDSVDWAEVKKFSELSDHWWSQSGKFRALHDLNPLRLQYIHRFTTFPRKRILDVGCGGGILAEAMASLGALVTGIDPAESAIHVAKHHHSKKNIKRLDYHCTPIEDFSPQASCFDVVVCMEMLEHTDQPLKIIEHCVKWTKPGGWVFFSTINRTVHAYIVAILAGEYLLRVLPRGIHSYRRFVKPSELIRMTQQKNLLRLVDLTGISYNPFSRKATLISDTSVNYVTAFQKM